MKRPAAAIMIVAGLLAGCSAFGHPSASALDYPMAPPPGNSASASTAFSSPGFLLTPQQVAALPDQRSRFTAVITQCDRQLSRTPHPVTRLALANHYSATGTNHASQAANTLAPDARAAYLAALCYLVTGQARYASHAQSIMDAWAATLTSAPTLQGKDAITVDMPYMVGAAIWVRGANHWNSAPFAAFLHNVVLPNTLIRNPNNHGMWAVLLEASIASFTGDSSLMGSAQARWEQILRGEVGADGVMPREARRSDTSNYHGGPDRGIKGIDYTHYTLLPASLAAKIFADAGRPVWATPGGNLLRLAFAKAAAWTLDPQSFPYYQGAAANLIGVDNASYFPLLLRYYPNADAAQVVASGKITADGFKLTLLF